MPDNTIAQNLPIFYSCGPTLLKTSAGVTVATQSNPAVAPPSTTSLQDNPNAVIQEVVVGAPHY